MLHTRPPRLSDVATVPWEIQKSHFQQYYSYIILIICVISEENKLKSTCPPHLKISPHKLVNCKTVSSDWRFVAFFQTLEALKRASCGLSSVALKRTSCNVWQLDCRASNVQSDHLLRKYMLPILFDTDQLHGTPCSAKIQPMSQQAAAASLNMSISIHSLLL